LSSCINTEKHGVSCTRFAKYRKRKNYEHCSDLHFALIVGLDADIEGAPLSDELTSTQNFVRKLKIPTPVNILNFVKKFRVRWVPCHRGMARPQVADGGEGLQIWRVAANILNKQSQTADRGCSTSLAVGGGADSPQRKISDLLRNVH
jgi:hypothetical protein